MKSLKRYIRGCNTDRKLNDDREQEWTTNKEKWDTFIKISNNPTENVYEMEFQYTSGSGVHEYKLPYIVIVADGVASEVKHADGTQVRDQSIIRRLITVDKAFELINNAWSYADVVTVSYDEYAGYPTHVFIDESSPIHNEEISFTIQNLSRLSSSGECDWL